MKKLLSILMVSALLATTTTACQHQGMGQKQTVGGLVGGAAGALAGAQFGKGRGQIAATAAGALLGAFLGSEAGASLDKADQMYHQRAANQALESAPVGRPIMWQNPDNGNSGQVIVNRTYQQPTGNYCREYQQTITVAGRQQNAYGTACRMPDGSWQVSNNNQAPQMIVAQPVAVAQPMVQPQILRRPGFGRTVITPSSIMTDETIITPNGVFTDDVIVTDAGVFRDDGLVAYSNGVIVDNGW